MEEFLYVPYNTKLGCRSKFLREVAALGQLSQLLLRRCYKSFGKR